jgi:hypothetical protein
LTLDPKVSGFKYMKVPLLGWQLRLQLFILLRPQFVETKYYRSRSQIKVVASHVEQVVSIKPHVRQKDIVSPHQRYCSPPLRPTSDKAIAL